jgi:mannose-6-phosphate isomerase-like protein (cupin superfamily)
MYLLDMPHVVRSADLPRLRSTRDGRDRVDLVTEDLFGFTDLKADLITYEPGDTAAAHYHVGARHIWFISTGRGIFHVGDATYEVADGDVATAGDSEVHWFENPYDEPFAFYELWVPAPRETIWVREDDV